MRFWYMRLVPLWFLVFLAVSLCRAQDLSCDEVTAISGMAESTSTESLLNWKEKAGDSYTAHLVYSFRSFELRPTQRQAASRLLSMIPPTKDEQPRWSALDGFLCKEQPVKDIKALAKLHARMPHDIARAVLLVPEKMREYVSYAYDSMQDPHSDYAVRMQPVCRTRHREFIRAVDSLAPDDKSWFVTKIFDPKGCRAIAVPESD